MPSLKEIRRRIKFTRNTQKVTSAMHVVSSVKLRRAQEAIGNILNYQQNLLRMMVSFLEGDDSSLQKSVYTTQRPVKKVTIIPISSNTELCGAYNANVNERLKSVVDNLAGLSPKDDITIFPIGKKVADFCKSQGYNTIKDYVSLGSSYGSASAAANNSASMKEFVDHVQEFADRMTELFVSGGTDQIVLVYFHFRNAMVQELRNKVFLPLQLPPRRTSPEYAAYYIVEPSRRELIAKLLPKVIFLELYSTIIDAITSEHASRSLAMQIASDNAADLLDDLVVQYNKFRQEAITNQMLDIVGGSME